MPELRSAIRRLLGGGATDDADGGRPRPKRHYLADATEGVARARAVGHERPMVVAIWPIDRDNPFQALLASRFEEFGIVPIGMDRLADLDDPVALPALVGMRADGVDVVLHLHWLARVLRGVEAEAEGRERVTSFLAAIDAFLATGGRLVWTVHNVLPHETSYPALDLELRRGVVARADIVHVLSAGTVAAAAGQYAIPPEKVLHVPHPAYVGVYPDDVSDADARRHYGIGTDDVVFGFVGNLRPYKGLDDLLDAFEAVAAAPPDARRRRLLIAGMPAADPSIEAVLARARAHPDVVVDARRLPAEELSLPLRASDVVVLPYRSSLNSGALLLALSFGRPVIAAASPHVTETVGPDASITFEPDDRAALIEALRGVDRLLAREAREAALATNERFDPDALSRKFATALRELVERRAGRGSTGASL
jgi:beta-1,4-mannosyltransferase